MKNKETGELFSSKGDSKACQRKQRRVRDRTTRGLESTHYRIKDGPSRCHNGKGESAEGLPDGQQAAASSPVSAPPAGAKPLTSPPRQPGAPCAGPPPRSGSACAAGPPARCAAAAAPPARSPAAGPARWQPGPWHGGRRRSRWGPQQKRGRRGARGMPARWLKGGEVRGGGARSSRSSAVCGESTGTGGAPNVPPTQSQFSVRKEEAVGCQGGSTVTRHGTTTESHLEGTLSLPVCILEVARRQLTHFNSSHLEKEPPTHQAG